MPHSESDRRVVVGRDRIDRGVGVAGGDRGTFESRSHMTARIGEHEVRDGPPVQVERPAAEAAEKPGEAGRSHDRSDTVLGPAVPRHEPSGNQCEPDETIGPREGGIAVVGRPLRRDAERETGRPESVAKPAHLRKRGRRALRPRARSSSRSREQGCQPGGAERRSRCGWTSGRPRAGRRPRRGARRPRSHRDPGAGHRAARGWGEVALPRPRPTHRPPPHRRLRIRLPPASRVHRDGTRRGRRRSRPSLARANPRTARRHSASGPTLTTGGQIPVRAPMCGATAASTVGPSPRPTWRQPRWGNGR